MTTPIFKTLKKCLFLVAFAISLSVSGQSYYITGSHNVTVGQSKVFTVQSNSGAPPITSVIWSTVPNGIATINVFNTNMAAITFNSPVTLAALTATVNSSSTTQAYDVTASHPALDGGSVNGASTICYSGDPGNLANVSTASGGVGGFSYQWQYSTIATGGWNNISGQTGTSYNPPSGQTVTRWYRRRATSGSQTAYSNTVQVTVNPNLNGGGISGTASICYGGDPSTLGNSSNASGGNGSYSYLWEYSNSGTGSWNSISGATGTTYNPQGGLISSRWYRRRAISCGQTKYSNIVQVTVGPTLIPGAINGNATICAGGDPGNLASTQAGAGGNGSYAYLWQYSNSGTGGWTNLSGATGTSYNPPAGLTSTRHYRRRIISCGQTLYSNIIQVTVNPAPSPGSINGSSSICSGGDPANLGNASSASGGDGSYSYLWQYSNSGTGGWTNIGSATGTSYNPPAGLTSPRWFRRRVISCGQTVYSNVVSVAVSPTLTSGTVNGASSICSGGDPGNLGNVSSAGGGNGSYAYLWQYSNTGTSGWTNISSATSTSYNPPSGLTSPRWFRRRVSSCNETKYSNIIAVNVSPTLIPGSINGASTICYGGDPGNLGSSQAGAGGDGSYSYLWQYSNSGTGSWTSISGATSTTYNPQGGLTASRWYRRRVVSCGQTLYSNIVQVTVNPNLTAGSINGASTVCYNGDPGNLGSSSNAVGGDGNYSYQWQSSNTGSGGWSNITGASSNTFNPPAGLSTTRWYRRNVTSCGQTQSSNIVEITVSPALAAGSINGASSICSGGDPNVLGNAGNATGGNASYTYLWQYSNNGTSGWTNISSSNTTTYNPPAGLNASRWYRRNVTSCGQTEVSNIVEITVDTAATWYLDADNDGFAISTTSDCNNPGTGYTNTVLPLGDCDDTDANINPDTIWYLDADNDNHAVSTTISCTNPGTGYTLTVLPVDDCDDTNAAIFEGTTWYLDADNDNFAISETISCGNPGSGYTETVLPLGDCDDTDATINPDTVWYEDDDNDGLGDPNSTTTSCTQPTGYVDNADDQCPDVSSSTNQCSSPPTGNCSPVSENLAFNWTGDNYVYTRTYQEAETTVPSTKFATDASANKYIQNITYFDGLGRAIQQNAIRNSPNKKDIVTHIGYDDFGRIEKEWLPFLESNQPLGSFKTGDIEQLTKNYYGIHYDNDFDVDINPYSQKKFEPSPMNLVEKQAAPGEAWKLIENGDDHSIEFRYEINSSADQVKRFKVFFNDSNDPYLPTLESDGNYPVKELHKSVVKDENHSGLTKDNTTEKFTDKQGNIVLKRVFNNGEIAHDTYYVYDDFGKLTYILPPKMEGSTSNINELGYRYVYDHRNRLVEKQIPGKGKEYVIYNKLDQPIMTQDINLRQNNEWLFTKYDRFGRIAFTGKLVDSDDRAEIQNLANDSTSELWTTQYTNGSTTTVAGTVLHYNGSGYPTNGISEILTIIYYDNYDFLTTETGIALPANVFSEKIENHDNTDKMKTKSLVTGSKVKVLDTDDWIIYVSGFDVKARPIYAYTNNGYLSTVDIIQTQLDFVGRTTKNRTTHTRNGDTVVTIDNFTYDHVGRSLAQTQCIGDATLGDSCEGASNGGAANNLVLTGNISTDNIATTSIVIQPNATIVPTTILSIDPNATGGSGNAQLIALNSYDDLGKLESKKVGGDANVASDGSVTGIGLQEVDYDFNVRGWLRQINDPTNLGDKLFAFGVNYHEIADTSKRLYNGNISQTVWNSKSINIPNANGQYNEVSSSYTYTYDAMNRIISGIDNTGNYGLSGVSYDKNGNIQSLQRHGHTDINVTTFGVMDDLTYEYYDNSNKLKSVSDMATTTGFLDGNLNGIDYDYDLNGSLTMDKNKGIQANNIIYNHLNLPIQININGNGNNGNIQYIYDATGAKLRKIVNEGNTVITDYAGDYIYKTVAGGNSELEFFSHAEGYVAVDGQNYKYVYSYTDHLGNVRLAYTDNNNDGSVTPDEIVNENNYYPFGLKHEGYNANISSLGNSTAKKYKYNGQEFNESLDLNMSEMAFRQYDPTLGRFHAIDRMAIMVPSLTPYRFGFNNPVAFSDPTGLMETQDDGGSADGLTNEMWIALTRPSFSAQQATERFKMFNESTGEDRSVGFAFPEGEISYDAEGAAGTTEVFRIWNPKIPNVTHAFYASFFGVNGYRRSNGSETAPDSDNFGLSYNTKEILRFASKHKAASAGLFAGVASQQHNINIGSNGKLYYRKISSTGKIFPGNQYTSVTSVASKYGKVIKYGTKGTVGVGILIEVGEVYEAFRQDGKTIGRNTKIQGAGAVGSVFGGIAGAKAGAAAGAFIGAWFGGVGAVPGALIGGIIGGAVGAFSTSTLVEKGVESYLDD